MPDDSYCACGDAAGFRVTEGQHKPLNLCPRCTVVGIREQLPAHWTVAEIPDEFDDAAAPVDSAPGQHQEGSLAS